MAKVVISAAVDSLVLLHGPLGPCGRVMTACAAMLAQTDWLPGCTVSQSPRYLAPRAPALLR